VEEAFDRLLVRPSADELVAALAEAARVAGRGGEFRQLGPTFWARFLKEIEGLREGKREWEELPSAGSYFTTCYVIVAWWTDYQGGRHFRVCGGNPRVSERPRQYGRFAEDRRSPLWHVYPDRVFRRRRAGRSEWLASCACGATGAPGALAWMGPCCGPCHDRRQEEIAPAPPPVPMSFAFTPGPVLAVAFAPDGRALALSKYGRHIIHQELPAGRRRDLYVGDSGDEMPSLAFFPDGKVLAVADPHECAVRLLAVAEHEKERAFLSSDWDGGSVLRVAVSPGGKVVAGCCPGEGVEVWVPGKKGGWVPRWRNRSVTAMTFSPDGKTLPVGGGGGQVGLIDTVTWEERERWDTDPGPGHVLHLAFSQDGRSLISCTGAAEREYLRDEEPPPYEGRVRVWGLPDRKERGRVDARPGALAFSPDGSYLAWVDAGGEPSHGSLVFWDVAESREAGMLEWDPQDAIFDLAFSPEGQTLATAASSGAVKLWPWRRLLEA
jgi:WD40 repeat protein